MTDDLEQRVAAFRASTDMEFQALVTIVGRMTGKPGAETWSHPTDQRQFGRCVELLDRFPEWQPRILELSPVSRMWKVLAEHWDELEALWRADPKSRDLYRRMHALIDPVVLEDSSVHRANHRVQMRKLRRRYGHL